MAAGQAQHQVQRGDRVVIVVGVHGGLQTLVNKVQHPVQVNVLHLAIAVHNGHTQLGSQVARAASHSHQATVQNGGSVLIGYHCIGGRQA